MALAKLVHEKLLVTPIVHNKNEIISRSVADQMIRNGDVELQAREEEIRFLKMQLQEEKRSHELLQRAVPNKRNLEQEIITLQIQVNIYLPLVKLLPTTYVVRGKVMFSITSACDSVHMVGYTPNQVSRDPPCPHARDGPKNQRGRRPRPIPDDGRVRSTMVNKCVMIRKNKATGGVDVVGIASYVKKGLSCHCRSLYIFVITVVEAGTRN